MNENNQSVSPGIVNKPTMLSLAPQWFAVLIAMTYAIGFLCVFTFLDHYGIHEGGEDFLKVRYIHAGILFLLFPVSILIPLTLKISLKAAEIKRKHSSEIFSEDIIDLRSLAKRLSDKSDSVSAFLSEGLDSKAQSALAAFLKDQTDQTNAQDFETVLVENLNRIILEDSFYDKERFKDLTLRRATIDFCEKELWKRWKIIRRNRLLLEDAQLLKRMDDRKEPKGGLFNFPLSTMFSFLNICGVFYFTIFTPRNFVHEKELFIGLIIFTTFFGPLATDFLVRTFIVTRFHKVRIVLRWVWVFALIVLDWWLFHGFFKPLRIIFWGHHLIPEGGAWYLFLVSMIPYMMWRFNCHAGKHDSERGRTQTRFIGYSLSLMFLYLAVVAFAMRVYPYIPAARGGGNYIESPHVVLTFRQPPYRELSFTTNDPIWNSLSVSNCFTIIEQTPTSLYLANIHDAVSPISWQKMRHLPHIIEVRRDMIDFVTYTEVSDTNIYSHP